MTDQQAPEFEEPAPPGAEPPLPTPESMQSTAPPPPPPVEPVPPATVSSGGDGGNRNLIILGFAVVIGLIAIVLGLQGGIIGGAGSSPEPSPSPAASPSAEPSASAEPSPSPSPAPPLASTLILGGPPECPKRPFCALGLKETYGLEFKEFRALDVGGPITVEAIKGGQIDVGLLFTSDPAIAVNGFVALVDDKGLQNADNIVPVVRQGVLDTSPAVKDLIDPWMAKLTQEQLLDLNKRVGVDQQDPKTVVGEWLAANGLQTGTGGAGVTVKIGSFNFGESETLGELLAQILEANGFSVERKFNLGNREIVFPALQSGEIDLVAEYAASVLEYVNEGAGEATGDPAATTAKLSERLAPRGLVALAYAPATDQNTFVVTSETASKYRLTKLSDLAAPSP